jgi:hypothetical protein
MTNTARPEPSKHSTSSQQSSSPKTAAVLSAILQVWPGAQVDRRDPLGVWSTALSGLTDEQIRAGVKSLSLSAERFPPTPGQFRAMCISAYRQPESRPAQLPDNSERARAWRYVQSQFAKRILSGSAYAAMVPAVEYGGPFDWRSVVAAAQLPTADGLHAHQAAFDDLRREFNSAWGGHGIR